MGGLKDELNSLREETAKLKAALQHRDQQDRQAITIAHSSAKGRMRTLLSTRPGAHIIHPAQSLLPNKVKQAMVMV